MQELQKMLRKTCSVA